MSKIIQGKNIIVYMLVDSIYYPVFCAKSAVLTQSQETIEVTSINSGNDREYEPGMTTTTLDVGGISLLDNSENKISPLYLIQLSVRRTVQSLKITLTANDNTSKDISFSAIITSNSITKDLGGAFSQASVSFIVSGAITISPVVDPPTIYEVQDTLYITGVAGQSSVSNVLLEATGVEILIVTRSGQSHNPTSGTPGNFEFKFTGGAGQGVISFDSTNPFNLGEVVSIVYKKPI